MRPLKTLRTEISGNKGCGATWVSVLLPDLTVDVDLDDEGAGEEPEEDGGDGLSMALQREIMTLPESDSSGRADSSPLPAATMSLDRMKACLRR